MATVTNRSGILLLLLAFAQVLYSRARRTEFVYGPRQHLDSGQGTTQSQISATIKSEDPSSLFRDLDSEEEYDEYDYDDYDDYDQLLYGNDDQSADNDRLNTIRGGSDYYIQNGGSVSEEDDNDNDYIYLPLKRVRRRIIPVGKAIERGRSDSGGPFERSRSQWEQPANRNREVIVRRSGPTGSAALFSLYPELAPPEWRARRGVNAGSKKKLQEDSTSSISERSVKNDQNEESHHDHEEDVTDSHSSSGKRKSSSRRRGKLSKRQKEEIAKFADKHGTSEAVEHFRTRLDSPIKVKTVEKFLKRYKTRMERKAGRS